MCAPGRGRGTRTGPTARRARPTRGGSPRGPRRASRTPKVASRSRRALHARRERPYARGPARENLPRKDGRGYSQSSGRRAAPERAKEAAAVARVTGTRAFLLDEEQNDVDDTVLA